MKKIFLITLFAGVFLSCESHSQSNQAQSNSRQAAPIQEVTITGKVKNPQQGFIVLSLLQENGFKSLDSVRLQKNNTYSLKSKVAEPGFYMLNFFDKQKILVILDNKNLEVNADGNSPVGDYSLKGSKDAEDLQKITKLQNELQKEVSGLEGRFQTANAKKDEKEKQKIQAQFFKMQGEFSQKVKDQIRKTGPTLASWYATNLLNPEEEYPFLDSLSKGFKKEIPNSRYVKDFDAKLAQYKNIINVGQQAPDITLNSPEGKPVSLSSLRGKYVLIDFWASWCGPCRHENPNVVRMYNKFKGKNFEIFGVSLDKSKDKWVEAIAKDGLSWVHVSDLQYWQSAAAKLYNVQGIPATFLIDPNGKVVAKNLRGQALEDKLDQVLAQ